MSLLPLVNHSSEMAASSQGQEAEDNRWIYATHQVGACVLGMPFINLLE
jgi:hypothetical protein